MKKDLTINSSNSSTTKMVVTSASASNTHCYIMKTEIWGRFRILTIGYDGGKSELTSSEDGLRALRCALNLMADAEQWDKETK